MIEYLEHLAKGGQRRVNDDLIAASVYTKRSAIFRELKNEVSEACKINDWVKMRESCQALIDKKGPEVLFPHFAENVLTFEHGLPELAPFLGREFRGMHGLGEYFTILATTLSYENMRITGMFVDPEQIDDPPLRSAEHRHLAVNRRGPQRIRHEHLRPQPKDRRPDFLEWPASRYPP